MKVLVTGSAGFIGRHVVERLKRAGHEWVGFTEDDPIHALEGKCQGVDAVVHLAGINRPQDPSDYASGNKGFTEALCEVLSGLRNKPGVIFSSSTQAALDNPYGQSKREAEEVLRTFSERGNPVVVFRFTNVFGKWARPNYNSAVATFCYNLAHGVPIQVSDPSRTVCLLYIDDAVDAILAALDRLQSLEGFAMEEAGPTYDVTLGRIVELIEGFRDHRETLYLPDMSDPFVLKLYATYTSYLEGSMREYGLDIKSDARGSLAEFIKSPHFGQIFVSRTHPGITRGNHYHHTKFEKFLVVEGEAVIRFRHVESQEVQEHRVKGSDYRVVDITPGWTHSIENVGDSELITLFWASEPFDPNRADTYFESVLPQ